MSAPVRWITLLVLLLVIGGLVVWKKPKSSTPTPSTGQADQLTYEPVNKDKVSLKILEKNLGSVTRIVFSPDTDWMVVSILKGDVLAYHREGDNWKRQAQPLLTITTSFPGFPPEENGLTGMTFGADYNRGGDFFMTYAFQKVDKTIVNRVARATLTDKNGILTASGLTDIFEGNTPAASSHQIQAINSLTVAGKPHVIFQMGEGFDGTRAQNLDKESGKLMIIQRDGSDPLGPRPYPDHPKIQAIGFRNPPDMEINPYDPLNRIGITDTGPDTDDRFIYGKFIDLVGGKKVQGLDLGWNQQIASLESTRFDPNVPGNPDPQLYRWTPTHTATNIVFHPGKGIIPKSTDQQTSVLVSLFGRTGETGPGKPGREIWLGTLTLGDKPAITGWQPFIVRSKKGIDEVGHPIALQRDPKTNDLVFADIVEGNLYWVTIKA